MSKRKFFIYIYILHILLSPSSPIDLYNLLVAQSGDVPMPVNFGSLFSRNALPASAVCKHQGGNFQWKPLPTSCSGVQLHHALLFDDYVAMLHRRLPKV